MDSVFYVFLPFTVGSVRVESIIDGDPISGGTVGEIPSTLCSRSRSVVRLLGSRALLIVLSIQLHVWYLRHYFYTSTAENQNRSEFWLRHQRVTTPAPAACLYCCMRSAN